MRRPATRRGGTPIGLRSRSIWELVSRFAFALGLLGSIIGFHPATAAHAQIGTPVANIQMPATEGGKASLLGDADASVLVFFRPNQERSLGALTELASCQKLLTGKSVHWAAIVSSSVSADAATAMVRESRIRAPVLIDTGDALYGSLGVSLHPVVVIVGRDHKLAAFEPFRAVNFCAVVSARIRHVLREITDTELQSALAPPRAVEGGNGQIARRYRALAEALFRAKNYEKALESVRTSIEKDPASAPAHALMGEILAAQGKCVEAVLAFRKALEIDVSMASATAGIESCSPTR